VLDICRWIMEDSQFQLTLAKQILWLEFATF
jgi:hypothetical protein